MAKQKEYRVGGELAQGLEVLAAKEDSTPEALLESIVSGYLRRQCPSGIGSERRAFKRRDISIPAMIYLEEDGEASVRYQPASIRDVSPGGLRVVCSGRKLCGRLASDYGEGLAFDVIFSFSEDMKPVRFTCRAARMEVVDEEVHIGARITASDEEGRALYDRIVDSELC